jgi:sec-independent protein translocase protein TatC
VSQISTDDVPADEVEAHRMPLMDHLRELRKRMMISAGAVGVAMLISLAFTDQILAFITAPVEIALADTGVNGRLSLVSSPFEGIYVYLRAAFLGAMGLASPVVSLQMWQFIAPGLYKTERRIVLPLAFASTGLFFGGAAFAYYVIFPYAFPFFFTVIKADVNLSVEGYLGAVIRMMMAFGVCFQLPVVTFFLARLGLIDATDMIKGFRYAVVAIFVVAAIITPPEVLTQVLLAAPLIVLYGVGIIVAKFSSTKVRA